MHSTMTHDKIRLRHFAGLKYYDPAIVLRELRRAEIDSTFSTLPDDIRQLRKQSQKTWREGRVGALFGYGMGQCVLGVDVPSRHEVVVFVFYSGDVIVGWRWCITFSQEDRVMKRSWLALAVGVALSLAVSELDW